VERATGRPFTEAERRVVARGPDEADLVDSGLEDTMLTAYHEIRDIKQRDRRVDGLRTAAFFSAIRKVATAYLELGIFP
jgi:glutamate dehydrogenase (NAD(P)+)